LNRITNKWDANWGKKYSKLAHDCGVEKKGFENTHIQKDTLHLFLFENGLNMFQFEIFCHLKERLMKPKIVAPKLVSTNHCH
jgi:hypothetical protein